MSEVLKEMKERRSIRKYKSEMVPQDVLDKIIEAGLYAASGKGTQNTIIIQVTKKELRDEIAEMNRKIGGWEEGFDQFRKSSHCVKNTHLSLYDYPLHNPILVSL